MAYVICNSLAYAHSRGDLLFSDVSFHVKPELADTLEHLRAQRARLAEQGRERDSGPRL
jgi:hypothetical protein